MITSLYRAIHYGEEIDLRANVLSSLRTEQTAYTLKQLESSSRTWEFACSMEWLDAHEVQKFLSEKGIQIQGNAFPFVIYDSNPGLISSLPLHLNVAAFIKYLSFGAICVRPGPAFRREHVLNALRFATVSYS
ncbi:uncharacterized protein PFLUO_LOCUS4264 [Penicillium psychrofluorescens]|uniref:uncharacterized protein n=1 Tax=Penicillium psychrofluorescens TaxID=3158075 RepID=UPI003CCCE3EB